MHLTVHSLRRLRAFVALALMAACGSEAFADKIGGSITFAGSVKLNTTSVNSATHVTSWVNAKVEDSSGDFADYAAQGDAVSINAPWLFNTAAPVSGFWQVGGFYFDLQSSQIVFQGYGFLSVMGSGMIYGNGFTPTPGTWNFSTQNPSARSQFSFSAASAAISDQGSSLALLALALSVFGGAYHLRSKAVNVCRGSLHSKS